MAEHDRAGKAGHKAERHAHHQQQRQIRYHRAGLHPDHRCDHLADIVRCRTCHTHAEQRAELPFRPQKRPHCRERQQPAKQREQKRRHAAHQQRRDRHAAHDHRERIARGNAREREQRHHIRKPQLDARHRHDRIQREQPLDERQHDRKRGQQAAERQFFCFQRITLPFQDTIASISSVSPTSLSTTRLGRQTATWPAWVSVPVRTHTWSRQSADCIAAVRPDSTITLCPSRSIVRSVVSVSSTRSTSVLSCQTSAYSRPPP